MTDKEQLRLSNAVKRLLPFAISWSGVGYRSCSPKYANATDILTGVGSQKAGGRYNPLGSFPAVYLSIEPETAFAESFAHIRYYGFELQVALPRTFVAVQLKLQRLLDLTNNVMLKRLKLSRRMLLLHDWRKAQDSGQEAVTQTLGKLAHDIGFEGMVVPSSAAKDGKNIIYFPNALHAGSSAILLNADKLQR
jgi:RES domain-containing protein